MTKLLLLALFLIQLIGVPFRALAAPEIPAKPTKDIYVQDRANVLKAETIKTINQYGKALDKKTKAQLVVVTIPTLHGASLEEYSLAILRGWGIGDKKLNNGVLMLVVTKDRKSRLEIGYGLEGALPDGKTGRIQDTYMVPYFRNNDFDAGILNGYKALLTETLKEYKVNPQELDVGTIKAEEGTDEEVDTILMWVVILIVAFIVLAVIYVMRTPNKGRGKGGSGSFSDPDYDTDDDNDSGFGGGFGGGGGSSRSW